MNSDHKSKFIHEIKEYCLLNNFTGVDMDLEWDNVTKLYSSFVVELKDTLTKYNLGLTAALPGTTRYSNINNEALNAFDVINLMVYDFAGPWAPNNPGQHSSYNHGVQSINYWKGQEFDLEKIRLGVPFYGYDFTNLNNITSFNYSEMVSLNQDYAYLDKVGEKYYNGINTIKKKTKLAKSKNLKGIMIWELGQDVFSPNEEFSLLKAINNSLTGIKQINKEKFKQIFHPNPFKDKLTIDLPAEFFRKKLYLKIVDINNVVVFKDIVYSQEIVVEDLNKGVYFYTLKSEKFVYNGRLIKI
jgi:GH18 family chitinase